MSNERDHNMSSEPIVASLAHARSSIGLEAANHFDRCWRDITSTRAAYRDESIFRIVTGEQHPLGNFVIISSGSTDGALEQAVEPLMHVSAPAAVFCFAPVSEAVGQHLSDLGFSISDSMPAMAVDIDAMTPTNLPWYSHWPISIWIRIALTGSSPG